MRQDTKKRVLTAKLRALDIRLDGLYKVAVHRLEALREARDNIALIREKRDELRLKIAKINKRKKS